jgi:hypothetical protein
VGRPALLFRASTRPARDHPDDAITGGLDCVGRGRRWRQPRYENTLYRARDPFFEDPRWRDLADWKADLAAHYDTAERMLGVTDVTFDSGGDILLRSGECLFR